MTDDELFPIKDKNTKAKRTPRRWSVIIIEILLVVAAGIIVFRLATTGETVPSLDAAKQYEWAMVHQKNREYEKALEAFTAAIDQGYTPLGRAYFERARVQHDLGHYNKAIEDYTLSIALTPDCDDCYVDYKNRGVAYWLVGDYDAAMQDFNQAIEINPRYLSAYVSRASLATLQGSHAQALIDMKRGLEKSAREIVKRGLSSGQQRSVELDSEAQQYHFTFSAEVGDEITLFISHATVDVVMLLQDDEGTPLAYDDSEAEKGGDSLNYVIEKTGDYLLTVAAYQTLAEGEITVTMTSTNPDENSSMSDLPRIDPDNIMSLDLVDTIRTQGLLESAVSPNGMIFVEKSDDQLIAYDLRGETIGMNTIEVGTETTWSLAASSDGQRIAVGVDKKLILYDAVKDSVQQTLRLGDDYPAAIAFSPDSAAIAVVVYNEVKIYDAISGTLLHTLTLDPIFGKSLTFSHDGTLLAVGQDEGLIQIWDIEDERLVHTLKTEKVEEVLALAFSPNANLLAAGGEARRVQVWDLSTGDLLQTYIEHERPITDLAFSPDGRLLVSGSLDKSVRVWDVNLPDSLLTLPHEDVIEIAAFQADGRTLLTVADDFQLRFWRVKE